MKIKARKAFSEFIRYSFFIFSFASLCFAVLLLLWPNGEALPNQTEIKDILNPLSPPIKYFEYYQIILVCLFLFSTTYAGFYSFVWKFSNRITKNFRLMFVFVLFLIFACTVFFVIIFFSNMFEYSFAAHELEIIAFLSFCFFLLVYQIYRYFSHAGEVYDAFKQNKVKAFNFIRTNVFITTILIAFSVTCIFCVSYYLIFLSSNAVTIYDFDFRIGKYPLFYSAHFCFILHFVSFLFFLGYKENSYINVIENALIFDNYVDVDKHDESEDAYIFSDEEKNKAIESKIAQATILRKESKTQPIANKIPASKVQVSTTKKITKPVVKIKGGKK